MLLFKYPYIVDHASVYAHLSAIGKVGGDFNFNPFLHLIFGLKPKTSIP